MFPANSLDAVSEQSTEDRERYAAAEKQARESKRRFGTDTNAQCRATVGMAFEKELIRRDVDDNQICVG